MESRDTIFKERTIFFSMSRNQIHGQMISSEVCSDLATANKFPQQIPIWEKKIRGSRIASNPPGTLSSIVYFGFAKKNIMFKVK